GARSNLESSGFTVIVNEVDSTEPEGKVLSVSDEGSHLREGSEVTLTVSRGNQFHMPNVSGKEFGQVFSTLRAAGWEGSRISCAAWMFRRMIWVGWTAWPVRSRPRAPRSTRTPRSLWTSSSSA